MTGSSATALYNVINDPEFQNVVTRLADANVGEKASEQKKQHGAYEPESYTIRSLQNYVDSEGNEVSYKGNLEDAPVIVNFMFTDCPMVCPTTTFNMRVLQQQLTERHHQNPELGFDEVKLLSITVNPTKDRPAEMAEYQKKFSANQPVPISGLEQRVPAAGEWLFLTRSQDFLNANPTLKIDKQDQIVFAAAFNESHKFMGHTSTFSMFDKQGRKLNATAAMDNRQDLQKSKALKNQSQDAVDPALQTSAQQTDITQLLNQLETHLRENIQTQTQAPAKPKGHSR